MDSAAARIRKASRETPPSGVAPASCSVSAIVKLEQNTPEAQHTWEPRATRAWGRRVKRSRKREADPEGQRCVIDDDCLRESHTQNQACDQRHGKSASAPASCDASSVAYLVEIPLRPSPPQRLRKTNVRRRSWYGKRLRAVPNSGRTTTLV
jgi:hypothetical protein